MLEVLVAFLILGFLMLPVFGFLTYTVKDAEKLYTEAFAISHARFVMDTVMFQVPWILLEDGDGRIANIRDPRDGDIFDDPEIGDSVNHLLRAYLNRLFGDQTIDFPFSTDGIVECPMGFRYRVRLKCVTIGEPHLEHLDIFDQDAIPISWLVPAHPTSGEYNVMKKLILEVMWSNIKGEDPPATFQGRSARINSIQLVAVRADLEEYR